MNDSQQGERGRVAFGCIQCPQRESDAKEDSRKMRKTVLRKKEKQVQTRAGGDG